MKNKFKWQCLFVFLCFGVGVVFMYGGVKSERYLQIELKRLEETYRLLDRFAEEVWPGWDNYNEVEFRVRFPNQVHLLYNPRKKVPAGYEPLPGITLRGKPVYINRQEELPLKVELPLSGGGKGGLTIRIKLRSLKVPPAELERIKEEIPGKIRQKAPGYQPYANSETQILLNVHEFFHGFQEKFGKTEPDKKALADFKVNSEYAAYSNIEGISLMRAYEEKDNAQALEYCKDFIVARQIKQEFMPPKAVFAERSLTLQEGTATYAGTRMAVLVRDKKYQPGMSQADDPFFFDFQFMNGYVESETTLGLPFIMGRTFAALVKCYDYGYFQCLLLDRFVPGWKKDFFQKDRTLDEMMADFLALSPQEKKLIANRLKTRYGYDALYAKHDAVIKEKDKAVEMLKNRKGKKYILDAKKSGDFWAVISADGKMYHIGYERLYPHGIRKYASGRIEITSEDTLLYSPTFYILEWVDSQANKGERGYEISFSQKVKDTYKDVVFKTKGFTLKAPRVQIIEDKERNEVRISILVK